MCRGMEGGANGKLSVDPLLDLVHVVLALFVSRLNCAVGFRLLHLSSPPGTVSALRDIGDRDHGQSVAISSCSLCLDFCAFWFYTDAHTSQVPERPVHAGSIHSQHHT